MVEGLGVLIALKKSPLEGNVAYITPTNTSLSALLQKLATVQRCWDSFSRWACPPLHLPAVALHMRGPWGRVLLQNLGIRRFG